MGNTRSKPKVNWGIKKPDITAASTASVGTDFRLIDNNGNTVDPPPNIMDISMTLNTQIPKYKINEKNEPAKAYRTFAINNHSHLTQTNAKLHSANAAVSELQNRPIDNSGLSYKNLITQNELIDKQIQENKDVFSTDDQKVYHQHSNTRFFKNINFYLMIIYYICVLGLILYFLYRPTTLSIQMRFFIVLIYLFLPFIKDVLEDYIYYYAIKLWSIINVNVYSHKDY